MEDRKRRVLQAIIDDYIHTAEPVGSRTVARKYGLGVSPATIRNEMADLEDMGYLEQPHTSAGRVPSDKGYRFYVDVLLREPASGDIDPGAVHTALTARAQRIDGVVRQATRLLAEMSDVLAVASQPGLQDERLAALQVVPLRGSVGVVVLVADDGRVSTRLVEFSSPPDPHQLDYLGRALSRRLAGVPLQTVADHLEGAVAAILGPYRDLLGEVFAMLEEPGEGQGSLVLEGTTNLLKQPEFRQVGKANQLLAALERGELLEARLRPPDGPTPGVEVSIGHEIQIEQMAECSIVSAVYSTPAGVLGRIGVLGPRRMPYGRMMAIVAAVAAGVTAALQAPGQAAGPPAARIGPTEAAQRNPRRRSRAAERGTGASPGPTPANIGGGPAAPNVPGKASPAQRSEALRTVPPNDRRALRPGPEPGGWSAARGEILSAR